MTTNAGAVRAGAKLVWRRQRVFWWVYAINLLLAVAGTAPMRSSVGAVLDHSLWSARLVHGFDLTTFFALLDHRRDPLGAAASASVLSTLVFFVFMLFLAGGILEVYRRDETLRTGEFFEACGRFFWRFVRLLIFLGIVLIPIFFFARFVMRWSDKLASNAPQPLLGFWVEVAGLLIAAFLLVAVRLWFDMAQVRTVVEDQRAMRRTVLEAFKMTWGNFGSLFWIYLRLCLLGLAGLATAFWVWVKLAKPESIVASFLLGQAVILLWIAIRLWLRASEMSWYELHFPPAPTPAPEPIPLDLNLLRPPPAAES
jgi:hypothetical protein